VLEAGQAVGPYHYEYAEEWLLVLEGEVGTRFATTATRQRAW
jgi:hypothetical protein